MKIEEEPYRKIAIILFSESAEAEKTPHCKSVTIIYILPIRTVTEAAKKFKREHRFNLSSSLGMSAQELLAASRDDRIIAGGISRRIATCGRSRRGARRPPEASRACRYEPCRQLFLFCHARCHLRALLIVVGGAPLLSICRWCALTRRGEQSNLCI